MCSRLKPDHAHLPTITMQPSAREMLERERARERDTAEPHAPVAPKTIIKNKRSAHARVLSAAGPLLSTRAPSGAAAGLPIRIAAPGESARSKREREREREKYQTYRISERHVEIHFEHVEIHFEHVEIHFQSVFHRAF